MYCSVTERFFEVVKLLEETGRQPMLCAGIPLYRGEAAFLEMAVRYPEDKQSVMAKKMSVTRAALTHMSGKLQEKGIIAIEQRENNKKEKFFRLTPKGEAVWADYLAQHAQSNRRLCAFFATLSPDEIETIFQFMQVLKESIPFCEFPCVLQQEAKTKKEVQGGSI